MADFDNFTAADTETNEKDLVADFLSREQDTLAELGDDEFGGFGGGNGGNGVSDQFADPFGAGGQEYGNVTSQSNYDPFSGQGSEYGQTEDHSTDPYNQIKQIDRQRAEPEKLRIWREEQVEMLQKKDAESERKKAEWRDIARRELEEWYKHRNEQVDKAKKVNRENEDAFVQQRDERKPGGEWERVCRQCDFNPKGSRNTKDVSRMRSILLQLKQTPIER
jgi:clathrin light chain A